MGYLAGSLRAWVLAFIWAAAWPLTTQAQAINDWNAATANAYGQMVALDAGNNAFVVGTLPSAGTILLAKYSPAGALLWQREFDNPNTREQGNWITVDAGGNAIVVGSLVTASTGNTNGIVVLKYDPMGNLLWQDVIASAFGYGHRVVADGAGNAYVLGRASGSSSIDIVTLKYSSDGVRQWTRYYGFDSTSADSPSSLVLSPAGNVLVAGGAVGKMLMVAYDPAGNQIWSKTVAASTGTTDIAVAATGEFYAIGGINSGTGSGNGALVIKHDGGFNEIWRKTYSLANYGVRVAVDTKGNPVVTGVANPGGGYLNWATFKLDPAGNLLWARAWNLHLYNDEIPQAMVIGPDDAIYLTGQGGPGPSSGELSYLRAVTLKYNADGHQNWAFTTFDTVRGLGLALGNDKALVVVGQSPLRVMHYKQDGVVSTTPVLTASADKVSGPAPLTVAFTPVAVDLFAPSYQWDFGDGAIARTAAASRTFAAGAYAVMVHAVFANGAVLSSDPLAITATYVPLPPVPTALVLGSSTVVGGKGTTGTVTVSGNAGAVVVLGSGNTTLVKAPASVQVPVGATSASFKITTSRVRTTTPVTITATANGASASATLTLTR
jgi:PKD repeat protein